jgi:hypothetical protein
MSGLYPVCPTCGGLLSNIQLPYMRDIVELCAKYNVDLEKMSGGIFNDKDFNDAKTAILDKYIPDRNQYCCRMRLTNFKDLARIVG